MTIELALSSSPTMASKGRIFGIGEITERDRDTFNKSRRITIFILTQIDWNVNSFVYKEILAALMHELESADGKVYHTAKKKLTQWTSHGRTKGHPEISENRIVIFPI